MRPVYKRLLDRPLGPTRGVVKVDGHTRLVRIGRDGKNRYCLYYNDRTIAYSQEVARVRMVVMGRLTKLAAIKLLKLMKEQ